MQNYSDERHISDLEIVERLIRENINDEFFWITDLDGIKSLPPSITTLVKVSLLTIDNCPEFNEISAAMTEMKALKWLRFICCQHKNLPTGLSQLTRLRKLSLNENQYSLKTNWKELEKMQGIESLELSQSLVNLRGKVPMVIFSLKKLQFLYLDNNKLKQLPGEIRQLKEIITLDLSNNKLSQLPYEISELKELVTLELGENQFHEFPDVLLLLPKLRNLAINAEAINNIPFELFDMPALKTLNITGKNAQKYPAISDVEKFFNLTRKAQLDSDFINLVLNVLKYPQLYNELEINELILLLNCKLETVINKSLERLGLMLSNSFSGINSGAHLLICGKSFEQKNILNQKLAQKGIVVHSKLSKKVTHVLLSQDLKNLDFLNNPKLALLTEKMLHKAVADADRDFIFSDSADYESSFNKIRELLTSDDTNSSIVALNLIQNYGLSDSLLTDLLFAYKKTQSDLLRKAILSLLKKQGNFDFAADLKKRMPLFKINKEKTLSKSLLFYGSNYKVESIRLVKMIFDKTKMGRHFALMHFETKDKIDFFEQIIENGQLNLSNCDLEKLPDDFEMFSKKVTSVNLSYNKFDEVPIKALLKLKNLTELKFVNANIWHYPDEIAEISKLETIYVPFSFAQLASANLIAKLNSMQVNIKSAIV